MNYDKSHITYTREPMLLLNLFSFLSLFYIYSYFLSKTQRQKEVPLLLLLASRRNAAKLFWFCHCGRQGGWQTLFYRKLPRPG